MSEQASIHSQSVSRSNDPLFKVKLLAALRTGDPALIVPLISELNKGSRASFDGSANEAAAAALHLAIRCASCETVQLLLQQRPISPNSIDPPGSGISALHLAASLGRADVVTLLLDQEEMDDTLRNAQGKTCKEVAKTREVVRIIQDSRSLLTASFLSLLRTYILSPPTAPAPDALLRLLQSPRIRNVDLNQLDAASGSGILHEAVRRKDLRLIELAVRSGADVFIRDRRGRGLSEVAGKDDRIKAYLKQFINHDQTLLEAPSLTATQEPTMRGYLNKYGNVAKGYNNRWFVLKDGMLSYYRHQDDENLACRGSLSMRNARVKASSTDKLKFEVHASTRNGEGIPEKWYMRANHAVEVSRWVQSLQRAIDWSQRGRAGDSDAGSIISTNTDVGMQSSPSPKKRFSIVTKNAVFGNMKRSNSSKRGSSTSSLHHEQLPTTTTAENYSSDEEDTSTKATSQDHPPHQESFELLGNTATAHIDLAVQLLASLDSGEPSDATAEETRVSLKATISQARSMFTEYNRIAQEREAWFKAKLSRERERAGIWEDSLHKVVKEGEELEEELKRTIKQNKQQRRRSRALHDLDLDATVRQKPARPASVSRSSDIIIPQNLSPVDENAPVPAMMISAQAPGRSNTKEFQPPASPTQAFRGRVIASRMSTRSDDSDSDEFFDAVEANALPNMVIPEPLKTHSVISSSKTWIDESLFEGYAHPRERLAISADNRPPVSLWAVLKGAVGKDLTRISFPVFFNEPTSMLQRMAEDMEFSECLDTAANERDPIKRIAYVAAFAMSNYSSTIGRIAKPFNPMLVELFPCIPPKLAGETFEYVRLDRQYRYVSEQVSHHPPISACWADSPRWHYYGEVDAKNKFAGKSFEIKPTGVAHADLKLAKAWAPNYPSAGESDNEYVLEHYSWKKVTTNVSGFIVGNPTIDHYGEMRVINHRTRDQCVLTFKPRGWRDAFEIKGRVLNARGEVQYDIAGRWNTQLVARKAGNYQTDLLPDVAIGDAHAPNQPYEYILLWRNTVKPVAPFRLTPYAITLNDCPETLEPYLPPTDCRLRPDQRAFELGIYERANELKSEQEDLQRATRKQRETGQLPPHRPRWFQPKTEADTGERYWAPIMQGEQLEYWFQRERVVKGIKSNASIEWKDVESIFVEADL